MGLLSDDAITVCQEKSEAIGCGSLRLPERFWLRAGSFWNENVELVLPSLGLKGDYQRENAAVALEAFFLYMEGLDQKWIWSRSNTPCKRQGGRAV